MIGTTVQVVDSEAALPVSEAVEGVLINDGHGTRMKYSHSMVCIVKTYFISVADELNWLFGISDCSPNHDLSRPMWQLSKHSPPARAELLSPTATGLPLRSGFSAS